MLHQEDKAWLWWIYINFVYVFICQIITKKTFFESRFMFYTPTTSSIHRLIARNGGHFGFRRLIKKGNLQDFHVVKKSLFIHSLSQINKKKQIRGYVCRVKCYSGTVCTMDVQCRLKILVFNIPHVEGIKNQDINDQLRDDSKTHRNHYFDQYISVTFQ